MLRNYLKIAIRNLWKNKNFSCINIAGLAIGLSCFLLIALYVLDELSFDKYNANADRIYRINSDIRFGGADLHMPVTSDMMGQILKKDYPQVEQYTRIYSFNGDKLVKKGNEYINEERVAHADSTFFDVFTLPAIEGDNRKALCAPNPGAVSESMAKKYFNSVDVLGKTLEVKDEKNPLYKVTAVIKDIPENSHFHFDFLFSMDNVEYQFGNFLSQNFQTYIVLKPGTDYKAFEKNFIQVIDKYILPQAKQFMQINSMEDFVKSGNKMEYSLMPVTDIHLRSDRFPELDINSNIQYVYIFSAVAIFILLLACVNFMNLSTARSANRAKEVGIRKVLGTEKKSLVGQFLTESTLMVFIGLLLAIALVWIFIGYFNSISGKNLNISTLFQPGYLAFLVALPLIV